MLAHPSNLDQSHAGFSRHWSVLHSIATWRKSTSHQRRADSGALRQQVFGEANSRAQCRKHGVNTVFLIASSEPLDQEGLCRARPELIRFLSGGRTMETLREHTDFAVITVVLQYPQTK